jgi:DNA invertase Pin-like site-specific DNA recombinase
MSSQVGYIRVSTVEQNTDRQLTNVKIDKMFEEKCSGKTIDRPIWNECLSYLRDGDTLHIHSLDRVCRSGAGDAVKIVEELTARNVGITFHKEGLAFNGSMSAAQKGILGILASVAQMERELIKERQLEGIAIAKAKGKSFGRPRAKIDLGEVDQLRQEGLSMEKIAKRLNVGVASIYRELKKTKAK